MLLAIGAYGGFPTHVSYNIRNAKLQGIERMSAYTAVVERDKDTGLYIGYVPGFPGAHSQGGTLDELQQNLREVLEMLLEDETPQVEAEFVGTQQIVIS